LTVLVTSATNNEERFAIVEAYRIASLGEGFGWIGGEKHG
jgi:hypothetical protein